MAAWITSNTNFATANMGYPHGAPNRPRGSALPGHLYQDPHTQHTLWLEHVFDLRPDANQAPMPQSLYWLVWYNAKGAPLTPASAIFTIDTLHSACQQAIQHGLQ